MPGPPLPCSIASDGPPVTPADCTQCCPARLRWSRRGLASASCGLRPLVACCVLPACILPVRFPLVPCDTSSPTPRQRWPPTVPRRPCARAGYEMQTKAIPTSDPGDCAPISEEPASIKMTNQQLDTPVHEMDTAPSPPLSTLGPLCTNNCAKGNATPVHPYPVVPSVSRPKPVSRDPVTHMPV